MFRMEGVEFFNEWRSVVVDDNCLGMYDIKPRRIGDTEKAVFLIWDAISRIRGSKAGMQNMTDEDAKKNFKRLVEGAKKMPFFFKPVVPSSDDPKTELEFKYPAQYMSDRKAKKGVEIEEDVLPPLNSFADFQPTTLGKYDGGRLTLYYLDEPGKIKAFDINSQLEKVMPTLTLYNNTKIVGKALLTTTVEEFSIGDSSTLANAETLWQKSSPEIRMPNGRTVSGLSRVFRSALKSAEVDEYGFPKEKIAKELILAEREMLEKMSDWDGLSEKKRKFPLSVEDVFEPSQNECVLFPVLLNARKRELENLEEINGVNVQSRIAKRGNLVWLDVFGGKVRWLEDPNGKWAISQHPVNPNATKRGKGGKQSPVMEGTYESGADPIDTLVEGKKTTRAGKPIKSLGAAVVYRCYDELIDGGLEKDEFGEIIDVEYMWTDQYVCDYQYRPDDPDEYCEDMLKQCIYFSTTIFCEKDKPSIHSFFTRHGFENYLKDRPTETKSNPRTLKKTEKGAKATPPLIRLYTDALKVQVYKRIGTFWHPRILECHSKYNVHNRSSRDLTVAAGFAKLADMTNGKVEIKQVRDDWSKVFFSRYKHNEQRYL
jgi:hypothetical protein